MPPNHTIHTCKNKTKKNPKKIRTVELAVPKTRQFTEDIQIDVENGVEPQEPDYEVGHLSFIWI